MDNVLQEILLRIGITPNLKGFNYIIQAVKLLHENEDKYSYITKSLYPEIAKMNHSSYQKVERCIRHAITKAINQDYGDIEKELGTSPYKIKMTNSEFLYLLLRKVRNNENNKSSNR